ncbi:MAG: hypothetical protein EOM08_12650 [Clostridia bacterium]|nr:hypothetical protein [Clostridia bacterium]
MIPVFYDRFDVFQLIDLLAQFLDAGLILFNCLLQTIVAFGEFLVLDGQDFFFITGFHGLPPTGGPFLVEPLEQVPQSLQTGDCVGMIFDILIEQFQTAAELPKPGLRVQAETDELQRIARVGVLIVLLTGGFGGGFQLLAGELVSGVQAGEDGFAVGWTKDNGCCCVP